MHTPAAIIVQYLIDREQVTRPESHQDWPVYYASLPDKPDRVVVVYDTGGRLDGRIQRTRETVIHPAFQVRLRCRDYTAGFLKISALRTALDQILNTLVEFEDVTYLIKSATQTTPIMVMGQDENRRDNFTLNGTLTLSQQET